MEEEKGKKKTGEPYVRCMDMDEESLKKRMREAIRAWGTWMNKEEILVHTVKEEVCTGENGLRYTYGELYCIELIKGQVTKKYGGGKLFDDDGLGTVVPVGSVIYVLGGIVPEGYARLRAMMHRYPLGNGSAGVGVIEHDKKEGHAHRRASCLDLSKVDGKWMAVPPMKSRDIVPCCAPLGDKIYSFGGAQSFVEVFNTQTLQWDDVQNLSLPPEIIANSNGTTLGVSYPVIPDRYNKRIILHIKGLASLYAYYPDSATLKCLHYKRFTTWRPCVELVAGVLYFHVGECPELPFDAYHIETQTWLKVCWSAEFDDHVSVIGSRFDALMHLGGGTLCLAACSSPDSNSPDTNIVFVKFSVRHTKTEATIQPISVQDIAIDSVCSVSHFLPL